METVAKINFYFLSATVWVYYLLAIIYVWIEHIPPKEIYLVWGGFYATMYLIWLIFMLWKYPKVILNFSFDGVLAMNQTIPLVPMSIAHYFVVDMFLTLLLTYSNQYSIFWKLYRSIGLVLVFLWAPVGMLFNIPILVHFLK